MHIVHPCYTYALLVMPSLLSPCSCRSKWAELATPNASMYLCKPVVCRNLLSDDTLVVCRAREPYQEKSCNDWLKRG